MKPETAETAELQALREKLLSCSPRREERPEHPELQIQGIEWRSRLVTARRRWFTGGAVAAALALVLGLVLWQRPVSFRSVPTHVAQKGLQLTNGTADSTVVDLGPETGRILLRPGTRASYAPKGRTLTLDSGRIVAHILPLGRGFRVRFGTHTVTVKGTLFGVDAETHEVRVWHGVVEHTTGAPGDRRTLRGTDVYQDLTPKELTWLAFTRPEPNNPQKPVAAQVPTPASRSTVAPPSRRPTQPSHRVASAPAKRPPSSSLNSVDPVRQNLLEAQKEMLAGRTVEALALLQRYEAQFPASPLLEEAWLLKIRALVRLRQFRQLQQVARAFLERFPASAKRSEVELVQQRAEAHLKTTGPK